MRKTDCEHSFTTQTGGNPADCPLACTHHWRIEEASGPTSEGYCLNCGETREFNNGWMGGGIQTGDDLHRIFVNSKTDWAGEWISERQRDNWAW